MNHRYLALLAVVVFSLKTSCKKADAEGSTTAQPQAAMPVAKPEPKVSPVDQIAGLKTFEEAVAAAKPMMSDTYNETSEGTVALAAWSATNGNLKWEHVAVPKDETSFALVQKDPDEERGKRYCASGRIIQINVAKTKYGKIYDGLLMDNGSRLWSFAAVASTGQLVQNSWGRFCGVVIGKYDYSNSGGGTGHAVSIVGMFELPENKL